MTDRATKDAALNWSASSLETVMMMPDDSLEISWTTEDDEMKPSYSARFRVRKGKVQVRMSNEKDGGWTRLQIPPDHWREIVAFIESKLPKNEAT